jgi:predicted DNA-binding transcriptional regulator AlpA
MAKHETNGAAAPKPRAPRATQAAILHKLATNGATLVAAQKLVIRRQEALALGYSTSLSQLKRLERMPGFPTPVRLGANSVGYVKADLDRWLAERPPIR